MEFGVAVVRGQEDHDKESSKVPPQGSFNRPEGRDSFSSASSTQSKKQNPKSAVSPAAGQAGKGGRSSRGWFATHGRDLRFLGLFAFFLLVFYLLAITPFARGRMFPAYLRVNAVASEWILNGLGENVSAKGNSLISGKFGLTIERGCDAVEPAALFCAAVLASPVSIAARLLAVALGTTLLMVLNLVRILSLYYVGAYYRKAFDVMHLDVWQAIFIFLALLFWAVWASWATRRQRAKRHAPTA